MTLTEVLIAASAVEQALPVATRDDHHPDRAGASGVAGVAGEATNPGSRSDAGSEESCPGRARGATRHVLRGRFGLAGGTFPLTSLRTQGQRQ